MEPPRHILDEFRPSVFTPLVVSDLVTIAAFVGHAVVSLVWSCVAARTPLLQEEGEIRQWRQRSSISRRFLQYTFFSFFVSSFQRINSQRDAPFCELVARRYNSREKQGIKKEIVTNDEIGTTNQHLFYCYQSDARGAANLIIE